VETFTNVTVTASQNDEDDDDNTDNNDYDDYYYYYYYYYYYQEFEDSQFFMELGGNVVKYFILMFTCMRSHTSTHSHHLYRC